MKIDQNEKYIVFIKIDFTKKEEKEAGCYLVTVSYLLIELSLVLKKSSKNMNFNHCATSKKATKNVWLEKILIAQFELISTSRRNDAFYDVDDAVTSNFTNILNTNNFSCHASKLFIQGAQAKMGKITLTSLNSSEIFKSYNICLKIVLGIST